MRKLSLLGALAVTGTLVTSTLPAVTELSAAAAPAPPPRVVSVSIAQGSVVRAASTITVSFNVAMDVASVGFASTLVVAQGSQAKWKVTAPASVGASAGGRTVVLGLARSGQQLPPGAYSLVVGPAAAAADGAILGYASVTDFVVAPEPSLWEEVKVSRQPYQIWVGATGGPGPVRDDEYLLKVGGQTRLSGGQHVAVVYATDAHGRLVVEPGLASQLENYAEEEGWLRLQAPSSVPGALALDPNSLAWATANGPGSALGNYLYGLAKSLGEDVAAPPTQSGVDQAEVASALADDGAPGTWASELASDQALLDMAKTGDKGYILAQRLTTLVSEGGLSLPGAGAAKALLDVLKTVGGASGFALSTLQQLYQAEWEAAQAATEAAPLQTIASALPSGDAFMDADITALLHFNLAGEQAAVAKAAAAYAANQAYDLGAELAKELVADSDPMAAAVVAGLDIGFFIASFTGWDKLRAAFYQAAEQAKAEQALVDGAQALVASLSTTTAPTSSTLDAALLAWRLARNTMADFYAECITIVRLDQWGQAVDSKFPGLEALVGVHPAEDDVPLWHSDEADRKQAAGLIPGLSQENGDTALAAVITRFPVAPAGVVPVSLCGTVITEPGHYVQNVTALVGPDMGIALCAGAEVGIDVAVPGVSFDLNGHSIFFGSDQTGVQLEPEAAGSLVMNGSIAETQCCGPGFGVADFASGALATHLQVSDYVADFLADRTQGSRFVDNIVNGFVDGVEPWPGLGTISLGGVSLDHANYLTVADNTLYGTPSYSVAIALQSSSDNQVVDNSAHASVNGIYAGCNGFIMAPPAHPLTHTTCAPSVGNQISGNQVTAANGGAGPAIALGSSTAHNLVSDNRVEWGSYTANFYLWDYNACGVNTWSHNIVSPDPPLVPSHLSNWACIK